MIMNMNIYITAANEEYLRGFGKEGESMSGYINRLLENARGAGYPEILEPRVEDWPEPSKNPVVNGEAYRKGHEAYEGTVTKYEMLPIPARDKEAALKEDIAISVGDIPDPYIKATTGRACGHGYDPKMCRYAKNGKPCKLK